jgi:ABC-2 type transport system ATP-binding protein
MEKPTDKNHFNIKGVTDLTAKGKEISFLYRGDINLVMKKISEVEISNLWIEEPNLEEIFMHYYEKED